MAAQVEAFFLLWQKLKLVLKMQMLSLEEMCRTDKSENLL